jgi:eukaryotic-like serine/threonine-protein kinase
MYADTTKVDHRPDDEAQEGEPESGLATARIVANRYRLLREISRGGMGILWLAADLELERQVAMKFMNLTRRPTDEDNRRFALEARAEALLGQETEHVVKVLDHGTDAGTRYIIMEHLIGEDLGQRLARVRRLSAEDLAPIVRQVTSALRRAHGRRLIHRDIKPENIFLSRRDDEERVKIVDFGIVKALGAESITTTSGKVLGTPGYMAPEQIQGMEVDHRTDLWAVGVVLYQALTGRLPFNCESLLSIVSGICAEPIPKPSSIFPELSPEVDAYFARALARPREQRFQSIDELAMAFSDLARVSFPPLSSFTRPSLR